VGGLENITDHFNLFKIFIGIIKPRELCWLEHTALTCKTVNIHRILMERSAEKHQLLS
jgi:hypothetical protein